MKARRIFSPRPPAAVRILMRRIYGDSAYMRSTTSRRLRMCKKARAAFEDAQTLHMTDGVTVSSGAQHQPVTGEPK